MGVPPFEEHEWEYEDTGSIEYGEPVFFVTEPECLGVLYGPDGEVILELYEERVPFGFRKDQ